MPMDVTSSYFDSLGVVTKAYGIAERGDLTDEQKAAGLENASVELKKERDRLRSALQREGMDPDWADKLYKDMEISLVNGYIDPSTYHINRDKKRALGAGEGYDAVPSSRFEPGTSSYAKEQELKAFRQGAAKREGQAGMDMTDFSEAERLTSELQDAMLNDAMTQMDVAYTKVKGRKMTDSERKIAEQNARDQIRLRGKVVAPPIPGPLITPFGRGGIEKEFEKSSGGTERGSKK